MRPKPAAAPVLGPRRPVLAIRQLRGASSPGPVADPWPVGRDSARDKTVAADRRGRPGRWAQAVGPGGRSLTQNNDGAKVHAISAEALHCLHLARAGRGSTHP